MKTSQLMLGDLVMFYGCASRIDGLWQDIVHIEGEPEEQYAYMQEIGSIPLTEEILERNGFELNVLHKKGVCKIELLIGFPFYVTIKGGAYTFPAPTSVHELQHALRLCGLNEIADNFKTK